MCYSGLTGQEVIHCPESLMVFVACWLIGLDKNPGVSPIGIGELSITKSVPSVISGDIQETTSALFSTDIRHRDSCARHACTRLTIYNDDNIQAILLVDASNAFNQKATLHTIQQLCSLLATILIHTGNQPIYL